MTGKEILKKSIKKAVNKGYKPVENLGNALFDATCHMLIIKDLYHSIIFSHGFAKAFWGNELIFDQLDNRHDNLYFEDLPIFQYHLQQMVLEKEPLKYLEKFLPVEVS